MKLRNLYARVDDRVVVNVKKNKVTVEFDTVALKKIKDQTSGAIN